MKGPRKEAQFESIKDWLLQEEESSNELIEAIVIGPKGTGLDPYWSYLEVSTDDWVILGRDQGLEKLAEEFDVYGSVQAVTPMYAWTATRVLFITLRGGNDTIGAGIGQVPRYPMPGRCLINGNGF